MPLGLPPEVKDLTAALIWDALANLTDLACPEGQRRVMVGGCARVRWLRCCGLLLILGMPAPALACSGPALAAKPCWRLHHPLPPDTPPPSTHPRVQEKIVPSGRGDGEFWLRANATCAQPDGAGGGSDGSAAVVELLLTLPEFMGGEPEVSWDVVGGLASCRGVVGKARHFEPALPTHPCHDLSHAPGGAAGSRGGAPAERGSPCSR